MSLQRRWVLRAGAGVAVLGMLGSAYAASAPQLVALVAERNAIAHDVAASKYPRDLPVVDVAREQLVLARKREQANQLGLDADAVALFYQQLIEANKLVQHEDYQRFRLGSRPPPSPALEQIRERIDAVDARLLAIWPAVQVLRADQGCTAILARDMRQWLSWHPGVSAGERLALVRALVGFCADDGQAKRSAIDEPAQQQE